MAERLPNAKRARIDPRKLRDYALNAEHPEGQYKITGLLQGPVGAARQVTTVWIVRARQEFAELVTIEPAARQKVK
jgi:hypothetical protein